MAKAKKETKRVRYSPEELKAIKDAIIAGESPKVIHEKFGTSLVNIHYHKAQLKKQGLLKATPAVKKGVPAKAAPAKPTTSKPVATVAPNLKTKVKPAVASASSYDLPKGPVQFVVNGIKVIVEKNAKTVSVGKKSIKVEF